MMYVSQLAYQSFQIGHKKSAFACSSVLYYTVHTHANRGHKTDLFLIKKQIVVML